MDRQLRDFCLSKENGFDIRDVVIDDATRAVMVLRTALVHARAHLSAEQDAEIAEYMQRDLPDPIAHEVG
jgi:hypothetical protein